MNEQNCHENGIEPYQEAGGADQCAHGKAEEQIAHVVGMTRPAPPAAAKEDTLVLRAIQGLIGRCDILGRLAPDQAFSSRTTDPILLVVDRTEKSIPCKTDSKHDRQVCSRW